MAARFEAFNESQLKKIRDIRAMLDGFSEDDRSDYETEEFPYKEKDKGEKDD